MSVLVTRKTRLIIQGITGGEGQFHGEQMIKYGTNVVGGVTPGKGGQTTLGDVPVFNSCHEAVEATDADTSIIYVPAPFAADAALEAMDAGIKLFILITEGVPTTDMMKVYWEAKERGVRFLGPNCPGLIRPSVRVKIGIMPASIFRRGPVGVISRSGTLTYEVVDELTRNGLGQSTCVGIGGDPIIGSTFVDLLPLYEKDPSTKAVVLVGEIGGADEEVAADYIKNHMTKPVVSFIAGKTAPPGKRMGHAGAIISGGKGTAAEKIAALEAAGIAVAERPDQIAALVKKALEV